MSTQIQSRTRQLKAAGFDESVSDRGRGSSRVRCSQCVAVVINNVAVHETGCPNQRSRNSEMRSLREASN